MELKKKKRTRWWWGYYFLFLYFLREIVVSKQNWREVTEISHIHPASRLGSYPHSQHLPPKWYICFNWYIYTDTHNHPKYIVYGSLLMLYTLWVWTKIWHVCIIMVCRVFHCSENLLCLVYSFPTPRPLATTDLFTVSIVSP